MRLPLDAWSLPTKCKGTVRSSLVQSTSTQRTPGIPRRMIFSRRGAPYAILFLLGCALYAGSLGHEWALDDPLVYTENPAVQEGLAGVPRILGSDAYAHLYERYDRPAELSGGRYRPLSIVTFALEHELFGNVPWVAHAGNILLYGLTAPLLFFLLRRLRPDRSVWAWVAALFFAVHPVHAEVVANVKSRDEILSLLFVLGSLCFVWSAFTRARTEWGAPATGPGDASRGDAVLHGQGSLGAMPLDGGSDSGRGGASIPFAASGWRSGPSSLDGTGRRPAFLAASGLCAFLALLSKEYGVSLLLLAPAMLFLFGNAPLRVAMRHVWPIAIAVALYLGLRISVVGMESVEATDLLNDPYHLATTGQTWATKLYVLLLYLRLLLWPHPLSGDYSYRQIAYRDFQDPFVWISVVLGLVAIAIAWIGMRRRHWIGFSMLFYLVHLFLISNLLVEIGATMGERLIYHASVGFVMLLAGAVTRMAAVPRYALVGCLVLSGAILTMIRVPDWKNDVTLFTHDVQAVPESARANANAGRGFLLLSDEEADPARKRALLERARRHLEKALSIDSEIVMAYFTLGAVQDRLEEFEAMDRSWSEARARFPDHPLFATYDPILADRLARLAAEAVRTGDPKRATELLERAVELAPRQATLWFNLGIGRREAGDLVGAVDAWRQALRLDPDFEQATEALRAQSGNSRSND